jgi:hypothetical protein
VLIRFNKSKDPKKLGGLTIIRDDGSQEYQAIPYGPGFITHDLAHYAAECELGLKDAFYSLLASGHPLGQLSQTAAVWERELPREALQAEFIAAVLQAELIGSPPPEPTNATTFNTHLTTSCGRAGLPVPRRFGEEELGRARRVLRELIDRWRNVSPGGTMELQFPPMRPASA